MNKIKVSRCINDYYSKENKMKIELILKWKLDITK